MLENDLKTIGIISLKEYGQTRVPGQDNPHRSLGYNKPFTGYLNCDTGLQPDTYDTHNTGAYASGNLLSAKRSLHLD